MEEFIRCEIKFNTNPGTVKVQVQIVREQQNERPYRKLQGWQETCVNSMEFHNGKKQDFVCLAILKISIISFGAGMVLH